MDIYKMFDKVHVKGLLHVCIGASEVQTEGLLYVGASEV